MISKPEGSAPRPRSETPITPVAILAAIGLSLALCVMLWRVVQLQTRPAEQLVQHMAPRISARPDLPVRGDVQDRLGRPLAVTRFGSRVLVDPMNLKRDKLDETVVRIAQAAGLDADAIGLRIHEAIARNDAILAEQKSAEPATASNPLTRFIPASLDAAEPDDDADEPDASKPRKPTRYLPLGGLLSDSRAAAVRALKIQGVSLEQRPTREYLGGPTVASLVGLEGSEPKWDVGVERTLGTELSGEPGRVRYAHDGAGRPLWMEPGFVEPAESGKDIRLSIDLEVQRIAYDELGRGIADSDAAGGRCVILDPLTGEVLALVDITRDLEGLADYPWDDDPKEAKKAGRTPVINKASPHAPRTRYQVFLKDEKRHLHPALGRNRCVEDVYEPGSTFKPFVWSTITELGLAKLDETFDTEGGRWNTSYGRYVEDVTKRDHMTWREVLINSSNIGMIKGAERLTPQQLHDAVVRFGFGSKTGIELPGEASGLVTPLKRWTKYSQTSYAHGNEVAVTPLQMVRAFSAFARPGELAGTIPQVHLRALNTPGEPLNDQTSQRGVIYRVLPANIATTTRETMAQVAENVEAKMKDKPAAGWRYRMFGKSGTAEIPLGKAPKGKKRPHWASGYYDDQYNSSFIAGAPSESPRLVVLVVIDDPGPEAIRHKHHYGSMAAGPVVRRIVERSLTYLGQTPSPVAPDMPTSVAINAATDR